MSIVPVPNPTMTVGIREIRQVKVYPLSFSDARKLKGLILNLTSSITELRKEGFDPMQVAAFILSVIEENITIISNMVLSEPIEEEEFSVEQVSILANHIYDMNEQAIKNLLGLWKKFRPEVPTKAVNP